MRPQTTIVLVMALVFGGAAALGVSRLTGSTEAPKAVGTSVVVAAVDLPRGGMIEAGMLKLREFPNDLVPPGAIKKIEDAVDRSIAVPTVKDEPLLESKLSPKGSGRGMAALVPPGMRAFTIQTPTLASGVAGFILPGNKVDVLLTMSDGGDGPTGGGATTTLLQKVEILAVDQRTDAPAENKVDANQLRSVTLVVTPSQAKLLDLGQSKGTLHLSLRNPTDQDQDKSMPATVSSLRYLQEKPWDERAKGVFDALGKALAARKPDPAPAPEPVIAPPAPEPARPRWIRTIRGTSEGSVLVYPPGSSPEGQ